MVKRPQRDHVQSHRISNSDKGKMVGTVNFPKFTGLSWSFDWGSTDAKIRVSVEGGLLSGAFYRKVSRKGSKELALGHSSRRVFVKFKKKVF